ncbi:mitochondrial carrier [Rhizoclosmatium globosum]|uniref:ADP/ATP translocase n=1 Tax=Rhizoclosmatium globosum TaxID=329046 RepID=A0A1Y2BXH1_9FUNG|nr:mitochondrial carrier [Rhizoclosmatium globosum]|eukprot:ORY39438.1 mitochondrial carrier [Rhizoclosmatium globosum]
MAAKPQKQKDSFYVALAKDFAAGGVSGAVSKTLTAPIERVKLVIQTQDANPKIISGEVPRYTGIGNAFSRIYSEQGLGAFWRGNLTNCIRYFPTQAINLASKDFFKGLFPRYSPKTEFWSFFAANMASGGLAGASPSPSSTHWTTPVLVLLLVSTLFMVILFGIRLADYATLKDVGSGKRQFNGLFDCLVKTARGPKGFGISVAGIIPYRGVQFGLNDTIKGLNPWDKETTFIGIASKWAGAQFSVIMSGYVTYPFDTVRRRLQMEAEKPVNERLYKGAIHCFNTIVAKEGTAALFKGAGANILRGTGAALVLVFYGELQAYLKA